MVGIGVVGFIGGAKFSGADEPKVYIPNEGVRQEIVGELKNEGISVDNELPTERALREYSSAVYVRDATSFEGLQFFENAETLTIQSYKKGSLVKDLRPIAGMKNLKDISGYPMLDAEEEPFEYDLTPLSNLSNLKQVTMAGAYVLDLSPFSKSYNNNLELLHINSNLKPLYQQEISFKKNESNYEMKNPVILPEKVMANKELNQRVEAFYSNKKTTEIEGFTHIQDF